MVEESSNMLATEEDTKEENGALVERMADSLQQAPPPPAIPSTGASLLRRDVGLDNCKKIFMFLVVVHHMSNLNTVYSTLVEQSDRSPQMLRYAYFVVRYRKWTEKVAVPGFSFLSGYFGKGFLPKPAGQVQQSTGERDSARWERTISLLVLAPWLWQLLEVMIGWVVRELLEESGFVAPIKDGISYRLGTCTPC